jgi:putative ABC transport system permease protein
MTPRVSDPPRLPARLLQALLPAQHVDEIAGDLHEEFLQRLANHGAVRTRVWYGMQVCRLVAGSGIRRLTERAPRDPHAPNPGDSSMRTILTESRQALRTLLKRPTLTAVVVLTLAVGLAANASMFQVIDALILRPFTFEDVDRVALVAETEPNVQYDLQESVAPATYRDLRTQADTFEHLAAAEWWDVNLAAGDEAERVSGFAVTANFFAALGAQPALGRTFTADEETRGNHRRVILSDGMWQRRFAGDPGVLGQTLLLDGETFEIVGVMPKDFSFPMGSEIWAPLAMDAKTAERRNTRYLTLVGRLAPGRTLEEANTQVAAIGNRLAQQYPETNKDRGAKAVTLVEGMRDQGLGPIVVLWQASAAFVLLIACANIANLLLARGAERQREMAVRTALGASRGRIVRELLIESAMLALTAVPLALALAWVGIQLIRAALPPRLVRFVAGWETMDVDGRLVMFTFGLAALTALTFGIIPAIRASRPSLTETLKDGGRGASTGRERQRLRRALVVGQIALALPLLVASGLSTLGAQRFLNGSQGYNPDGLLAMRAVLPEARYGEPEARRRFVDAAGAKLAELTGVRGVAIANILPSMPSNPGRSIEVEGKPNPDPANPPRINYRTVTPDFFATLQIPVVRGRGFSTADGAGGDPVVILSERAVTRFFPGVDPLGRRVRLGDDRWLTVVGIAGDVIHNWFAGRNEPTAYRPYTQAPTGSISLVVRSDGDPSSLAQPAAAAIRGIDRAQALYDVMTMREALHERTIGLQYVANIMAVFGIVALLLAVVGVYSVMAFMVTQRTHEIGVRIALGASRGDVFRLTVGSAARMTAIGVSLGLLTSFGVSRALGSVLNGILAADLRVSLGVAAVLIAAALLAGYIPARRASGIDPMVALRD